MANYKKFFCCNLLSIIKSNLFSNFNYAIIIQINLERMGYPMPQLEGEICLNLLELFLANKAIYYTTVNYSNKLNTMQKN